MKNPDDIIQEELSDLVCRELTGSLDEVGKQRLKELETTYGLKKRDPIHIAQRLRKEKEFEYTGAWISFRKIHGLEKQAHNRKFLLRFGISVAAVIVLFIGIRLWIGSQVQVDHNRIVATNEQIIVPGKSKAVITLANGEKIELGNTTKKLKETNGTYINLDSSTVIYNAGPAVTGELVLNTLATPKGGEYTLILADGSKVWVNAESKLSYPVYFTGLRREVFLEGEAYFEVAKDTLLPFVVHTSRGEIEVLGTGFNVRDYSDERKVVTTLVTGRVAYHAGKGAAETIVLAPGYQVEDKVGERVVSRRVDVSLYVAWKDGKYIFENATLEEIMQSLSRWYDFTVFYEKDEVKRLHFTGDLERYENIRDFLDFLEIGGNVEFTITGKNIVIK